MMTIKNLLIAFLMFSSIDLFGQLEENSVEYKLLSNYLNDLIVDHKISQNDTLLILERFQMDSIITNQNNFKIVSDICEFLRNKKQSYFAIGYSICEIEGDSIRIRININQVFSANKKKKSNGCTLTTNNGTKYGNLEKDYYIKFDCTIKDWMIKY